MSPKDGPIKLDFSEAAARRAALSDTLQHPLTLLPTAIGGVAAVGLAIFSVVTIPVALGIFSGGAIVGGAHFAFKFFGGGDGLMQKHYADLHEEFEEMKRQKSAQLVGDLKKLKCKQGQLQVGQLEEKFQNLVEVFRRVLSQGELTYSRFVGTAEQGYRAGLENLERIVVLLMNTDDIDRDEIGERIADLEKMKNRRPADEKNLSALRSQASVYDQSEQEVEDLLAANEEALATMDQAGAAAVRVKDRSASQTPQESMAESLELLRAMIGRANKKRDPAVMLDQDKATVNQNQQDERKG